MKYKKYILLALVFLVGCTEPNVKQTPTQYTLTDKGTKIKIIEVDSCEYIFYKDGPRMAIAHKGNCKYCTERAFEN